MQDILVGLIGGVFCVIVCLLLGDLDGCMLALTVYCVVCLLLISCMIALTVYCVCLLLLVSCMFALTVFFQVFSWLTSLFVFRDF